MVRQHVKSFHECTERDNSMKDVLGGAEDSFLE